MKTSEVVKRQNATSEKQKTLAIALEDEDLGKIVRQDSSSNGIWTGALTVPNLISAVRISLIPVFAWAFLSGRDLLAFGLLFVIGTTDWVDGFVARRTGQISNLGKLLDPVADRLAVVTVLGVLVFRGTISWPLAGAILLRDVMLSIAFIILQSKGYPRLEVNFIGKSATAALFFGMGFAVMSIALPDFAGETISAVSTGCFWLGVVLYWVAGLMYLQEVMKLRKARTAI